MPPAHLIITSEHEVSFEGFGGLLDEEAKHQIEDMMIHRLKALHGIGLYRLQGGEIIARPHKPLVELAWVEQGPRCRIRVNTAQRFSLAQGDWEQHTGIVQAQLETWTRFQLRGLRGVLRLVAMGEQTLCRQGLVQTHTQLLNGAHQTREDGYCESSSFFENLNVASV